MLFSHHFDLFSQFGVCVNQVADHCDRLEDFFGVFELVGLFGSLYRSERLFEGLVTFFKIFGLGLGEHGAFVLDGVFVGEFGLRECREFGEFHALYQISLCVQFLKPGMGESVVNCVHLDCVRVATLIADIFLQQSSKILDMRTQFGDLIL
jgi:hypothetical protein